MTYADAWKKVGNITLYEVTIHFDWQDEAADGGKWHCGTREGAHEMVAEAIKNGADWYSVEEHTFIPCDPEKPGGRLYIGCNGFEFKVKGEDY